MTVDNLSPYLDTRLAEYSRYCFGQEAKMRVPEVLKTCVCFLCVKSEDRWIYGGTAFFVSVPSEMHGKSVRFGYLVTARHNIVKAEQYGTLYVRINAKDGRAEAQPITRQWYYPDDQAIDAAVMPIRLKGLETLGADATALPVEMFATDKEIKFYGIGIGEDLFITGLFTSHYGTEKNLPILRTGIIAAMPEEPLRDENSGLPFSAYLAEVRSIGGLSGSPVFALVEELDAKLKVTFRREYKSRKFFLLGLIRGHWDHNKRDSALDYASDELTAVNKGIATVTPIQAVHSILYSDDLKKRRHETDMRILKKRGQVDD